MVQKSKTKKTLQNFTKTELISLFVSVVALTVSTAGIYFTTFDQLDDLGVVMETQFPFTRKKDVIELERKDYQLVLINSGNRAVAITSITLIVQISNENKCYDPWLTYSRIRNLQPFVVKEKELVVRNIRFFEREERNDRYLQIPIPDKFKDSMNFWINVCLHIELSTPSVALHTASVQIADYPALPLGFTFSRSFTIGAVAPKPFIVFRQRRTIFSR